MRLPSTLQPGQYLLKPRPTPFTVEVDSRIFVVPAPPEGIVDSAYAAAAR